MDIKMIGRLGEGGNEGEKKKIEEVKKNNKHFV